MLQGGAPVFGEGVTNTVGAGVGNGVGGPCTAHPHGSVTMEVRSIQSSGSRNPRSPSPSKVAQENRPSRKSMSRTTSALETRKDLSGPQMLQGSNPVFGDGVTMEGSVGWGVDTGTGCGVGCMVGWGVGMPVVGWGVGWGVASVVGAGVGWGVASDVGAGDGWGDAVGMPVGSGVASAVGAGDGWDVAVGMLVGSGVGGPLHPQGTVTISTNSRHSAGSINPRSPSCCRIPQVKSLSHISTRTSTSSLVTRTLSSGPHTLHERNLSLGDGAADGSGVTGKVGDSDGIGVGASVGEGVGCGVGSGVGSGDGCGVGDGDTG